MTPDARSQMVLACSEDPDLLRQLIGKARDVANQQGWRVAALPLRPASEGPQDLGKTGVDLVYQVESRRPLNTEIGAKALNRVIADSHPGIVLIGATKFGMEIAPRVAERAGCAYAAWTVDLNVESEDGAVVVRVARFSGIAQAIYRYTPAVALICSVAQGVFEPLDLAERPLEVMQLTLESEETRLNIMEERPRHQGGTSLETADMILDIGQGVEALEDLEVIRSLSELLGGQLACTRPVSSDRDWFPDWLGLSGKKVSPELCLTLGVSGQIQHIVGIRDSRLIAAVNKDEGAAIFSQADYGIVADVKEFVPVLIERIKARGVKPAWASE